MSHIHIPDGVLPVWLWLPGWLLALALVIAAGRYSERADVRRKVPLLAVLSALMLVAMSSEIVPIAYHINLTVVAGVLLGPVLSVIAAFIVQIVLAMLGHGGVTVLGLNMLMTSAEMILGWALFRAGVRLLSRTRVRPAAAAATVVTLAITTTLLVGLVALSGGGAATARETGALNPTTLSFANPFTGGIVSVELFSGGEHPAAEETALSVKRFAAIVYTLGSIGWMIEALITAWILGYIARMRPGLLWGRAPGEAALEHRTIGHESGGR
ncbi:MAG: hypothetical protein HGA39_03650 [Coriobacteriia bacterium]|nr:hypothetical protein [Coriobacteriia bacterium]